MCARLRERAQEKYLKKKQRKHDPVFQLLRASPRATLEMVFASDPHKALCLRPDALALLLALANVRAGVTSIVVDSTGGIVASAVAERQGGAGRILLASSQAHVPGGALKRSGVVGAAAAAVLPCPFFMFDASRSGEGESKGAEKYGEQRRLLREGADCLVIAAKYAPVDVLTELLPFLKPSGSFVVFNHNVTALNDAAARVRKDGVAVNVQVAECFFREQQVLPNRTHPVMRMSAASGFVLSGIAVVPDSGAAPMAAASVPATAPAAEQAAAAAAAAPAAAVAQGVSAEAEAAGAAEAPAKKARVDADGPAPMAT
jgi:tRNA (adenine-N(1)-)-methyltransferase non-catalytic subunit